MERIDRTLEAVLKKIGLWKKYEGQVFVQKFNEEYPKKFNYNIEATDFKKGILVVGVKHPALMSNLLMMKPAILKELREKFGVDVRDIKFRRMKSRDE